MIVWFEALVRSLIEYVPLVAFVAALFGPYVLINKVKVPQQHQTKALIALSFMGILWGGLFYGVFLTSFYYWGISSGINYALFIFMGWWLGTMIGVAIMLRRQGIGAILWILAIPIVTAVIISEFFMMVG